MKVSASAPSSASPDRTDDVIPEKIELSAEELEKLTSDSEGGPAARVQGWLGWLTGILCFGVAAYALYWTQFSINTTVYRSSFLVLCLLLIFILYPLVRAPLQSRRPSIEEWLVAVLGVVICAALYFEPRANIPARSPFAAGLLIVVGACFALQPLFVLSRALTRVQLIDWVFVALSVYTAVYLALNLEAIKTRAVSPTANELVLGCTLILLILEGTRRTVGWILPFITVLFLIYCYLGAGWLIPEAFEHRGFTLNRIIGQNYLTLEGVFSTPMDVAATFIILFTLYGAVLDRGGAGKFFIEWAFALFGKKASPSAPGRAVVSSGFLLGTVSGSGVATTVTVASLAWPMLKKAGYTPNVAGGMLSAAGIGATLSPPTLGAAAFIIAEYLDVDYIEVLIYATIPTILYYLSCWLMTEADARRLGVKPIRTSTESVWELTKSQGYHFASLAAIAIFLALNYTSFMAVFWSIAIAFGLSMIRKDSRLVTLPAFTIGCIVMVATYGLALAGIPQSMGLAEWFDGRISVHVFWGMAVAIAVSGAQALLRSRAGQPADESATRMIEALVDGTRSTLGIVATCACAGVIVSVVNLTGLGLTISAIIVSMASGITLDMTAFGLGVWDFTRLMTIFLAALAMWVLGLAVPVTASYILAAVMLVPALVKVGVPEPAAHMFMFYYAVLADVSPPTALAPFAAAAITGGKPFNTMWQAWKYTLPAFLVPFMFCLTPEGMQLLMFTPEGKDPATLADWGGILMTTLTSCLALAGLCVAFTGYARGHATGVERWLCGIGGAMMLTANIYADLAGFALLAAGLALHWLRTGAKGATPAPA